MKRRFSAENIREFLRKEYFEPEVAKASWVTLALAVPLLIGHYNGNTGAGVFAGITAQLLTSARIKGTYASRALMLTIATLAVTATAFVGTLAGSYPWAAVIFMALVAFVASMARGIGDYGQVFGLTCVILFLISLRGPNTIPEALHRASLILLGGIWAMLVVLIRWPLQPNAPFYLAIGRPWHLSKALLQLTAKSSEGIPAQETAITQIENDFRKAIGEVLPWLKRKTGSTAPVRREALKLARASSRLGATALALHSELEDNPDLASRPGLREAIDNTILLLSQAAGAVSDAIINPGPATYTMARQHVEEVSATIRQLAASFEEQVPGSSLRWTLLPIQSLLEATRHYFQDAILMLARMERKKQEQQPVEKTDPRMWLRRQWRTIRLQLQPNSLLLQHSLRVALVAALGMGIYYVLELPRGYWIVLTVVILLQPEFGTTVEKTRDRLLGTLFGVLLGSLLLIASLHYLMLMVTVVIGCFLFVYLQPKNYKLSVVFVTIMLVALLEVSEHITWYIVAYRLLATLIGGTLAIGASYLLWPRWESLQFPALMAKAIRANKNYVLQIGHELRFESGFHARVIADRRKAEVENINAQDSIKRLQLEPSWLRGKAVAFSTLVERNKQLTRELTAFAAFLPGIHLRGNFPEADQVIVQGAQVLEQLADSVANNRPFQDNPNLDGLLISLDEKIEKVKHTYNSDTTRSVDELYSLELLYAGVKRVAGQIKAMTKLLADEKQAVNNQSQR